MFTNKAKKFLAILMSVILVFSAVPFGMIASAAKTVNVLDGKVSITDSVGNGSVSNGVVTITAKGSMLSKKTNNITVTNESGTKAKLSFSYAASTYNSFKIQGATANSSGTFSSILETGSSVTIAIVSNSGLSNTTATLTLSDFSLVEVTESSNITFNYDKALGSIKVDGVSVEDGYIAENVQSETGAALVATPVSGAEFLGWVNTKDNSILSQSASDTITPAEDMVVKAVFIDNNSKPHFMVGALTKKTFSYGLWGLQSADYWTVSSGKYLFDDLNAAAAASALNSTSKGIVLLNNGTLSAGDYTIPAGVTLLIPFDNANTLYKTEAESIPYEENGVKREYTPPEIYRNLKMSSGANIIIEGEMSLSSKHMCANGGKVSGGSPVDSTSMITMEENSSITVNNGGKLYAYGYITGQGSVTAKSGSEVYENFQTTDFRGGSQSTDMKNGVFPISQYYVQNIEVPLTIEAGAKENSYTTLYMSSSKMSSAVGFIGPSGCMFNLTSGYVKKTYDGSRDRLNIELNGELNISPIKIEMGTTSLDSAKYELPVANHITLTANGESKVSIGQDVAMLPGSEIIIKENAKCIVGSGVNVYIYDADEWGNYTGAIANPFAPLVYVPGRTYNRTNADIVDAKIQIDGEIDASAGYVYTTAGGANVFSTGTGKAIVTAGTQEETHQYDQGRAVYDAIPITPVKFKNADESYLSSTSSENTTYTYAHEEWWAYDGEHKVTSVVTEPTCKDTGYTTHTCPCGYELTDSTVPPTGHSYNSVENAPTCTESGSITYTCSVCKDSYTENGKDALGHSYGDWIIEKDATHSSEGSKYQECSVCKDKVYENISVIICDYNGDGNVNGTELAMLRKFLLGTEKPDDATKKLFDMNDNGELSIVDLVKLKKYIADIN